MQISGCELEKGVVCVCGNKMCHIGSSRPYNCVDVCEIQHLYASHLLYVCGSWPDLRYNGNLKIESRFLDPTTRCLAVMGPGGWEFFPTWNNILGALSLQAVVCYLISFSLLENQHGSWEQYEGKLISIYLWVWLRAFQVPFVVKWSRHGHNAEGTWGKRLGNSAVTPCHAFLCVSLRPIKHLHRTINHWEPIPAGVQQILFQEQFK